MSNANPNTPQIPPVTADVGALANVAQALKQAVDSLCGFRGGPFDRAVTFADLINLGLVTPSVVSSPRGAVGYATQTTDLGDVTAQTIWTPVDSSGAGLTFTVTDAYFFKLGKLCIATAAITWPATGSVANVVIGGLPVAAKAGTAGVGAGAIAFQNASLAGVSLAVITGSTTLKMFAPTGAVVNNNLMSTCKLQFTAIYISE